MKCGRPQPGFHTRDMIAHPAQVFAPRHPAYSDAFSSEVPRVVLTQSSGTGGQPYLVHDLIQSASLPARQTSENLTSFIASSMAVSLSARTRSIYRAQHCSISDGGHEYFKPMTSSINRAPKCWVPPRRTLIGDTTGRVDPDRAGGTPTGSPRRGSAPARLPRPCRRSGASARSIRQVSADPRGIAPDSRS